MNRYDQRSHHPFVGTLIRTGIMVVALLITTGVGSLSVLAQSTYTVDATGDEADATPGDGRCETVEGTCTLRAALEEANTTSNSDVVAFGDLSTDEGTVIAPEDKLPTITETVTIDGTTAPGYSSTGGPVLVLDGSLLSESSVGGLELASKGAGGSILKGLVLVGFPGHGVIVEKGADNVTIEDCYVGVEAGGETAKGNGKSGLKIESDSVLIGTSQAGNVISGNVDSGVTINGAATVVRNNRIGVDASAEAALPNGRDSKHEGGVLIATGSDNDVVNNVISGNDAQGIFLTGNSYRNSIRGNYIGTNRNFRDLGNTYHGIRIDPRPMSESDRTEVYGENIIGFNVRSGISNNGNYHVITNNYVGAGPGGENLGNGWNGIRLASENSVVGRAQIDGEERPGNVIGFNTEYGIEILEGKGNAIQGNYIGTNAEGEPLGNGAAGIEILARGGGSTDHIIGYAYEADVPGNPSPANQNLGNAIAYNGTRGVILHGDGVVLRNAIRGNQIYRNGADDNEDIAIDLQNDGTTFNDGGDSDEGPNNLQNAPEIDREETTYNTSTGDAEVRYRVDCTSTHCEYGSEGLKVDFYLVDTEEGGEGKTYLHTDTYSETMATQYREISFSAPSSIQGAAAESIVATATDAHGNTSEFSLPAGMKVPVDLAGFEAAVEEGKVRLSWETTGEWKNTGFHIQHRGPGDESFSEIDFVEGAGTTNKSQRYTYTVEGLDFGTHGFRLLQVSDGGRTYLLPEQTVNLEMGQHFVLEAPAPNPVHQEATFKFGVREAEPVQATLYDALGRKVQVLYDATPSPGRMETVRIDASGLPSGRYFVQVTAEEAQKVTSLTILQ